jgi:hypothetical protein
MLCILRRIATVAATGMLRSWLLVSTCKVSNKVGL